MSQTPDQVLWKLLLKVLQRTQKCRKEYMTTITPLGRRVLIEPLKPVEKTSSGLFIPDSAQQAPQEANVISIGSEVKDIAIGDRVIYSHYAGTKLDYDGHSYIVVEEIDVICTVKQQPQTDDTIEP